MKILFILSITFIIIAMKSGRVAAYSFNEMSVVDAVKYSDIVFNGVVVSKTITKNLSGYGVKIVGDPNSSSYTAMLAKSAVVLLKFEFRKSTKERLFQILFLLSRPLLELLVVFLFKLGDSRLYMELQMKFQ